ncbi:MAG: methylmalonyl-CoA mutase [Candidatus Limnocylindrus sp.]
MGKEQGRDVARDTTASGARLETTYGPNLARDTAAEIGSAGAFPYTRGVQETMYRGRLWTMRQYAGFSTARESNERYRYLLEQGQTGLSVAFDLPTQMGYDSDAAEAEGEVGRVGVAIDSIADMETLFQGIPLDKVSTSMTINSTAPILLALYVAVAERQGVSRAELSGTTQNDLLKEYIARGTYIFPPEPSLRLITDVFEWCATELPKWNTISISGYHMREAGATAAQELAFTFADAIAYVDAAVARGLAVDAIAPRLSFFFAAWTDILEEVAKFRAARRIWARIMRDRYGAKSEKSLLCRFHVQTAGSTLTAQSIDNNVVRAAYQALAAVLGGAQSLHVNGKDEALALPTEASARLALRTQQVLAHEAGVAGTVDPLGGSYAVEALTDQVERDALALIAEVDRLGGMVAAVAAGFPQRAIQDSAYAYQREVESGERVIVGVNRFVDEEVETPSIARIDPAREREQVAQLQSFRAGRDAAAATAAILEVIDTAKGSANMMPPILAAVKAGCTVGEISAALRSVWGEHRDAMVL